MTQTLDTPVASDGGLACTDLSSRTVRAAESRIDRFLGELRRMAPEERIRASRYTMNRWEYSVYAGRFPDEVPTINGELERIAATLE